MKDQIKQRLNHLKAEYDSGRSMLAELENKQAHLRDTLLRISGAIQVLEETLAELQEEDSVASMSTESNSAKNLADTSSNKLKIPKLSDRTNVNS